MDPPHFLRPFVCCCREVQALPLRCAVRQGSFAVRRGRRPLRGKGTDCHTAFALAKCRRRSLVRNDRVSGDDDGGRPQGRSAAEGAPTGGVRNGGRLIAAPTMRSPVSSKPKTHDSKLVSGTSRTPSPTCFSIRRAAAPQLFIIHYSLFISPRVQGAGRGTAGDRKGRPYGGRRAFSSSHSRAAARRGASRSAPALPEIDILSKL